MYVWEKNKYERSYPLLLCWRVIEMVWLDRLLQNYPCWCTVMRVLRLYS